MRIAIVSDIHGNLTAFEAVLADLRRTSPDLILHGGDLADGGASPSEVVDQIRDLGWPGVAAKQAPGSQPLFAVIGEMAEAAREALGDERLAWLRALPRIQIRSPAALVHASPESAWRAPLPEASDAELQSVYSPLGRPITVHAHVHRSYIRSVSGMIVANTGSVSLSYDGDLRAAYLLLDDSKPVIRRVEYDLDKELKALSGCGLPHAGWIARMLQTGRFQVP
ncbi:MAG: metallophosphoesterase [Bryobacterales bacterium]|nr:metallophosphoesterase [Bryobacterales bacterium]